MNKSKGEVGRGDAMGCLLSKRARSLWAKTDPEDGDLWLPLYVHASDAARTMERLWDEWLPNNVKGLFARQYDGREELARKALIFLAGAHDIGKATPIFQAKPCGRGWDGEPVGLAWKPEKAGLHIEAGLSMERRPTHPIAGQALLDRYLEDEFGWSFERSDDWGSVIGAHHGNVPEKQRVHDAFNASIATGNTSDEAGEAWREVQHELLEYARQMAKLDGTDMEALGRSSWDAPTESVACGLIIMADWIASNQELFPLLPLISGSGGAGGVSGEKTSLALGNRADRAWDKLSLTSSWSEEPPFVSDEWFCERFGLPAGAMPRPVQRAAMEAADKMTEPSLMVIEAPMGEGKTEAALAAAEIVGARFGCGGVCVALPTMATTDAMFGRVRRWLDHLAPNGTSSIFLAHGKAQLNEEYRGIVRSSRERRVMSSMGIDVGDGASGDERVVVSDWMQGRKKGMLASFVVCTVDQVLMGALDMRHLSLRHLALAGKVVIVDECHAYDSYMQQYLKRVLEWLGAWGCPVILLSATLPTSVRDELVSAYQGKPANRPECPASDSGDSRLLASLLSSGQSRKAQARKKRQRAEIEMSSELLAQEPYPLLTVASGSHTMQLDCPPSSRSTRVEVTLMRDDEDALIGLLKERLLDGGVAGVVCDTVSRAQEAYRALKGCFGEREVMLTHSRFLDLDRMDNESRLRGLLGPDATVLNGKRPERLIVVGTQVLEQSLDIDFDLLVTDVAPIDLLMQRLGRVHRHARGMGEKDRPARLRSAQCLIRGIEGMSPEGPAFAPGVSRVYEPASLMEALSVSGLCNVDASASFSLPGDIARLVRTAYSPTAQSAIPETWHSSYEAMCGRRKANKASKRQRAETFLLPSSHKLMRDKKTLTNLFAGVVEDGSDARMNEGAGQRAVRDTQETVEVLLVRKEDGRISLLPWISDEKNGVERGQEIPTVYEPDWALSAVLAQCAVRLPASLCRPQQIDRLIEELEGGCERWAAAWQGVPVLAGRLALAMEESDGEPEEFETTVLGQRVRYTREEGLSTARRSL